MRRNGEQFGNSRSQDRRRSRMLRVLGQTSKVTLVQFIIDTSELEHPMSSGQMLLRTYIYIYYIYRERKYLCVYIRVVFI